MLKYLAPVIENKADMWVSIIYYYIAKLTHKPITINESQTTRLEEIKVFITDDIYSLQ